MLSVKHFFKSCLISRDTPTKYFYIPYGFTLSVIVRLCNTRIVLANLGVASACHREKEEYDSHYFYADNRKVGSFFLWFPDIYYDQNKSIIKKHSAPEILSLSVFSLVTMWHDNRCRSLYFILMSSDSTTKQSTYCVLYVIYLGEKAMCDLV
jgi:hypothetical protein